MAFLEFRKIKIVRHSLRADGSASLLISLVGWRIRDEQNRECVRAYVPAPVKSCRARFRALRFGIDPEPLDRPASHQVLVDDGIDIVPVHVGVPDTLRVDDDNRSFAAAIQAPRIIDAKASSAGQPQRLDPLFRMVAQPLRTELGTAPALLAAVGAKEDVVFVIGHIH